MNVIIGTQVKARQCPFCGSKPVIDKIGYIYNVRCDNDNCLVKPITIGVEKEKEAINNWDKRYMVEINNV